MEARISKWGNSLGIRLPQTLTKDCGLNDGDTVDISNQSKTIIIRKTHKYVLRDLLGKIKPGNLHEEVSFGDSVGTETW